MFQANKLGLKYEIRQNYPHRKSRETRSYGSLSFAPREELIVFEAILTNPDKALAEISD